MNIVHKAAQDLQAQQDVAMSRDAVHHGFAKSLNSSVTFWTIIEAVTILLMGAMQLKYIKGSVENKQVV